LPTLAAIILADSCEVCYRTVGGYYRRRTHGSFTLAAAKFPITQWGVINGSSCVHHFRWQPQSPISHGGNYYRLLSQWACRSQSIIHWHTDIRCRYTVSIHALRCNHYRLLCYASSIIMPVSSLLRQHFQTPARLT